MSDGRTNRAAERSRRNYELLNDRQFAQTTGREVMSPDFVRIDRRPLITQPRLDRDQLIAALLELEELSGTYPRLDVDEVIDVRGDRLVAYRLLITMGDSIQYDIIDVARFDESVDQVELVVRFDIDDRDAAIAELDRLHSEIGG